MSCASKVSRRGRTRSVDPWIGWSSAPAPIVPMGFADPQGARAAMRAASRFLLRVYVSGTEELGFDTLTAIVLLALVDASCGHIDQDRGLALQYAAFDVAPPDGLKRLTTTRALAARLSLPYETTRRRVQYLVKCGLCVRSPKGLYAPVMLRPEHRAGAEANFRAVRNLLRELHLSLPYGPWPALSQFMGSEPTPSGLVARRSSAFGIDLSVRLTRATGDYDTTVAFLALIEATGLPGQEERPRFVQTLPLARSIRQPTASVRRRLSRLDSLGLITRGAGGYSAAPAEPAKDLVAALSHDALIFLVRLFSDLERLWPTTPS